MSRTLPLYSERIKYVLKAVYYPPLGSKFNSQHHFTDFNEVQSSMR